MDNQVSFHIFILPSTTIFKKKLSCRYCTMSVSCATVNTGRLTLKTSLPWMKVHLHVSRVNQRKCVPWTTKLIWSSSIKKKIKLFKDLYWDERSTISNVYSKGWTNNIDSYQVQSFEISPPNFDTFIIWLDNICGWSLDNEISKLKIAQCLEPVKFTHLYMNVSRQWDIMWKALWNI